MSLQNGKLPLSLLATIPGTNKTIRASLLPQTVALREAFRRKFGKSLSITSAYRTYASQTSLFQDRFTTNYSNSAKIDKRYWAGKTWWRKKGKGSSATPGTSNHGWGLAIDFGSNVNVGGSAEHSWMVKNAPSYGWNWPKQFRKAPYYEPWHFEGTVKATYPGKMTSEKVNTMNLNDRIDLGSGKVSRALNGLTSISVGGAFSYSAAGGWLGISYFPTIVARLAQIEGILEGLVKTIAEGIGLDSAEFLDTIRATVLEATRDAADDTKNDIVFGVVEGIRVFIEENPQADSEEIASLVLTFLGQALTGDE